MTLRKLVLIISSLIVIFDSIMLSCLVYGQPADLGAFGSHNEFPNGGIVTYSISTEERVLVDYVFALINYTFVSPDGRVTTITEDQAKYGEGQVKNVDGTLIHVTNDFDKSDHSACTRTLRGSQLEFLSNDTLWIALIRRGNCTFEEKVRNVYERGAIGAIIYDDKEATVLDKMKIVHKERNITAVITLKSIGEQMARIIDDGNKIEASISRGKFARPNGNINKTSVLFVSISFIVLMIISFVWLVFYYVQRFRYLQTKDRKSRQLCTVAKRIIAKIPTKSIKSEESSDTDSDCCAICIEPYRVTDIIRVLPCRHEFHKSCIDPWLLEHRTCPMCKMDILKHYGFVFTASQESILQLDLDTDDGGENNSSDEVIRAHSASPSLVQLNNEHSFRRHTLVVRSNSNHSIDDASHSVLYLPERDEKCTLYLDWTNMDNRNKTIVDHKAQVPVGRPCTLKKCKSFSEPSYRGSNNCYVRPADYHLVKLGAGCPKSRTVCAGPSNSSNTFTSTRRTNDLQNQNNTSISVNKEANSDL